MSNKAYILVEGVEEIAQAERLKAERFPEGVVYVSLSSQAKYELMRKGLEHVNAYDYCDLEELYRVTDLQYEDLRRQCVVLDELLESKIPELVKYGIKPFFFNYYQAKIILDTLKQRSVMVRGLYKAVGDRLYAFAPSVSSWSGHLKPTDRMTGYILEGLAGKAQILPRDTASYDFTYQPTSADISVAQWLSHLRRRPKQLYERILRKITKEMSNLSSKGAIWSLSPFIPSESLIASGLKRKQPEVKSGRVSVIDVRQDVFDHPAFTEMVDYIGSESRPILEDWIRVNVLDSIPQYISQAQNVEEMMARDNPVLLESGTYFGTQSQLLAAQFIRHGKKIIGTNHGSLGLQNEKMFGVCDLHYVSDYFVWAPGVKDYIAHQYPFPLDHDFNVHVSGTGHYDTEVALRRLDLCRLLNIPEDKTIVLIPGSGFAHNIFYNWYLLMTEQQEYENQTKLVDFFADRDDCVFIYKGLGNPHHDESHIRGYIASKNTDNVVYMNKTSLRYILPAIDVFITDRPSTSMLEAMGCGKICYSYNRWMTFPGDSASLYNEAAQHFLTPEAMLDKFAADAAHKFSDVPRSLDYYKAYGNATNAVQRRAIFTDFLSNLNS